MHRLNVVVDVPGYSDAKEYEEKPSWLFFFRINALVRLEIECMGVGPWDDIGLSITFRVEHVPYRFE